MTSSVSLGTLGRILALLAPLIILWHMRCIFLYYVDSGMITWVLLDTFSWTVFPHCDMLRRISSSQSNLSSIACEFFRRTMSYVLFRSSLVPFSPRLVRCRWKPGKDIGCETILGIWETWIDPSIWEIWIRSRCNKISSLGFTIFLQRWRLFINRYLNCNNNNLATDFRSNHYLKAYESEI